MSGNPFDPARYPLHHRMHEFRCEIDAVAAFIEWLHDRDYVIAGCVDGEYVPSFDGITYWLAEHFDIDPSALSREKEMTLLALQTQHLRDGMAARDHRLGGNA